MAERRWTQAASVWFEAEHGKRPTPALVLDALQLWDEMTVVDVGCGPGQVLVLLAQRLRSARLIGVDPCPTAISFATRSLRSSGLDARVELHVGAAKELPVQDHQTDLILAVDCFDYWEDPGAGLSEFARVLKPEGKAVFVKDAADDNVAASGAELETQLDASGWEVCARRRIAASGVAFDLWITTPPY